MPIETIHPAINAGLAVAGDPSEADGQWYLRSALVARACRRADGASTGA